MQTWQVVFVLSLVSALWLCSPTEPLIYQHESRSCCVDRMNPPDEKCQNSVPDRMAHCGTGREYHSA